MAEGVRKRRKGRGEGMEREKGGDGESGGRWREGERWRVRGRGRRRDRKGFVWSFFFVEKVDSSPSDSSVPKK